jgi:signal transduction histidine kinase
MMLRVFAWLLLLWGAAALGANPASQGFAVEGVPFLRNYPQKEHGGAAQNWAVVQDRRGIIYVGNNLGVLEYDGARWRLIQTPRGTTVRSLALDAEGRVWVGACGEIGYLAPGATGQTVFVDLTSQIEPAHRAFSDVWMVAPTRLGLLFQSREALFLWRQGRFETIPAKTTFHLAFAPGGRIFVRQREVGLMELTKEGLRLVPEGGRFASESIFMMAVWDSATAERESFLIGSRNLGLWRFDGRTMQPVHSDAAGYLKANSLYHGIRLADGGFALGTLRGGLVLLDSRANLRSILNRRTGLLGNNIKHVYADPGGNLWLALDNGIAKAELPSPFTRFDALSGLEGIVWGIALHKGNLYAATGQGVFLRPLGAPLPEEPRFRPVQGIRSGTSALMVMDDHLLAATSQGVFSLRGDRATTVRPSSNVAISLLRSRRNPARVFVGLQGGLSSLRLNSGRWVDEGLIPGVTADIYSMAESDRGDLWLGTSAEGVLRAAFPPGWQGGTRGGPPVVSRFGAREGLPTSVQTHVHREGNRILFGTRMGFYRFDEESRTFGRDESLAGLFPDGPRWIRNFRAAEDGSLWIDAEDESRGIRESGAARRQSDGSYRWDPEPFRRICDGQVESFLPGPDGCVWFGTTEGMLRWDPKVPRSIDPAYPAIVRRVLAAPNQPLNHPAGADLPTLPFTSNSLRLEFALPSYDQENANRFRVRLDGYDRDWSAWGAEAFKEYTNLPAGTYRFRVQGRNLYGRASGEGAFAFRILQPWYRAWWACLLYVLSGGGLLLLGLRFRTRLLEDRNTDLQRRVDQATEDLRERERQLAAQAGVLSRVNADLQTLNLQLRDANEEKNQFLGVVVHDLRNPLNSILLAADLIGESKDLGDAKAKAARITRRVGEMNAMIGGFLDIAALDAGKLHPEPETFALRDLAQELVEHALPVAQKKSIRLLTEADPGDLAVVADPRFLRVVIDNLLSNAVKFSPPGGLVVLRLRQMDPEVEIAVEDSGPGLTEEDQQRLFGRFVTLSARPTGGEKSTGLGLSIVKKMVDAMGARIQVESLPGAGCTFRVRLPGAGS